MNLTTLLAGYKDPYLETDYVSLGCAAIDETRRPKIQITLPYPCAEVKERIQTELTEHLRVGGVSRIELRLTQDIPRLNPRPQTAAMGEVRNIIAVASGKGGVGKSTIALALAQGLKNLGARTGLLDADIYGPSQAYLLDIAVDKKNLVNGKKLRPQAALGLQTMSLAYLIAEEKTPAIWRGAMASNALQQLLFMTEWKNLDYLIIDLPPGTGDIQLTLCQRASISGALIITTPHQLALMGATKGVEMFRKLYVPIIGMVENMSYLKCDHCGAAQYPFGKEGAKKLAAEMQAPLLAEVPIATAREPEHGRGLDKEMIKQIAKATAVTLSRLKISEPPKIRAVDD